MSDFERPEGAAALARPRSGVQLLTFPRVRDPRGNLTPVEGPGDLPFRIKRVYWIYDVPGGAARGGHAYRENEEVFVAASGSFDLTVEDETGATNRLSLSRSYYGVYIPPMHWRQLSNFSTNSVCLVFASTKYDEDDYIRDLSTFRSHGTP